MLIVGLLTRQPNVRELIRKTDKWCLLTNIIITECDDTLDCGLWRPPNCQTSQSRLQSWCWREERRLPAQSPHGKHYQQTSSETTVNMKIYVDSLSKLKYISGNEICVVDTAPSWCISLNTQHCDTVTPYTCSILNCSLICRVWSWWVTRCQ